MEFIENGKITLIASTTENPYFYVYNAILSRSTVFEFKSVEKEEVARAVKRGFLCLEQERNIPLTVPEEVVSHIASACGGDVRKAMNAVELCALSAPLVEGKRVVTLELAQELTQRSAMRYDREGDEHYDIVSAYQKDVYKRQGFGGIGGFPGGGGMDFGDFDFENFDPSNMPDGFPGGFGGN